MRTRRLVDTSAWIELFRPTGDPVVRRAVEAATREGAAVLCEMVLLELWAGAAAHERRLFARLAADVDVLPIDAEVWKEAHALAQTCHAAGVTVPVKNLLIAACAAHHGVDILEHDAHFAKIAAARKKAGDRT